MAAYNLHVAVDRRWQRERDCGTYKLCTEAKVKGQRRTLAKTLGAVASLWA